MIYDCFLYNGELDILLGRLEYLNEICDYFIVVEGQKTFMKTDKELDIRARFIVENKYQNKIKWLIFEPDESLKPGWQVEAAMREEIKKGLIYATKKDLILISDVDEIPSLSVIKEMCDSKKEYVLEMEAYKFDYHLKSEDLWHGTIGIFQYSETTSIQKKRLRAIQYWKHKDLVVLKGGWHFSSIGGTRDLRIKIKSFSHSELNIFSFNNYLHLGILRYFGIETNLEKKLLWLSNLDFPSNLSLNCTKRHKFIFIRSSIAAFLQPRLHRKFIRKIGKLSSPEDKD